MVAELLNLGKDLCSFRLLWQSLVLVIRAGRLYHTLRVWSFHGPCLKVECFVHRAALLPSAPRRHYISTLYHSGGITPLSNVHLRTAYSVCSSEHFSSNFSVTMAFSVCSSFFLFQVFCSPSAPLKLR